MINSFTDEYFFLSNFYEHGITYQGKWYPSTENAYQAAKVPEEERDNKWDEHLRISPGQSKKLGRKLKIREDWEQVKDSIMYEVCQIKFQDAELERLLLDTGDQELIEGNTWGDRYWGQVDGVGKNKLGKVLMTIRFEKRLEKA